MPEPNHFDCAAGLSLDAARQARATRAAGIAAPALRIDAPETARPAPVFRP